MGTPLRTEISRASWASANFTIAKASYPGRRPARKATRGSSAGRPRGTPNHAAVKRRGDATKFAHRVDVETLNHEPMKTTPLECTPLLIEFAPMFWPHSPTL